jgi:ribosome-binding factor A
MPREFTRSSRLAEQIQRDLSDLIRLEVRDPRVGLVTVTEVDVSRDLSHAKVYVTSLAGGEHALLSVRALQHAAGFLRSRLAQNLKARTVPELHFVYDESVERGIRLSRLIDEAVETPPPHDDPA